MATLFQRIIGNVGVEEPRIPIHAVKGMFGEISRGEMAPTDFISAYELTPAQQGDLSNFLTKLSQHPDKVYLGVVMFDLLALAELGIMPEKYQDEAMFWTRIDAEIAKDTAP